jgi:cyclic patellamide precursor peptide PatG
MEQSETNAIAAVESPEARGMALVRSGTAAINAAEPRQASPPVVPAKSLVGALPAQADPVPCPTCGGAGMEGAAMILSYVYALGQIEARFPRPSVEKELAQATGRAETAGRTDQQAFFQVLSQRENRYLARQMCWVLMIQGLETYILQPRDPADIDLLITAIEPHETPWISTVIGTRGPIAPPDYCNGLMVPITVFDQIYTFSRESLIDAIPRPDQISAEDFRAASRELFDRIMQMTDNAGATDGDRALNYLAVRYPAIYAKAAEEYGRDFSQSAVEVRPSPLSGTRRIVDVIFSYTNRNTDFTEKFFVRLDITEEFPFLVTKLSPYFDR